MAEPDRVRRLLGTLSRFRQDLGELAQVDEQRYVSERAYEGRYLVQAAAQTCIDLANHVISSAGWRVPSDFRDAFTILEEQEVIGDDLAERLRSLVGMRNRLVHLYDDVDDRLVHAALADGLTDVDDFAHSIARLVRRDAAT